MTEKRIAVLLGAGASVDAGLPMSTDLTKLLVEKLGEQLTYDRSVLDALHFVCSAMIGHRGSAGESPYAGINVEKMFSAVRLLSERAEHEAAPFVSSWLPGVEGVDAHPVESLDREIIESITSTLTGERGSSTSLTHLISSIARAAVRPGDGSVYRKLENKLLPAVCTVLSQHEDVTYLEPLANLARNQKHGLDIATLNYDLTLETMCSKVGVPVETGMDKWIPGHPIVFDEKTKQIRLFKLHGSIDWSYRLNKPDPTKSERLIRTQAVTKTDPSSNYSPAIVIGDREKLGGDGPTLALMREFERRLERADRLVVVGYSFADNHVNAVIRNWINTGAERSLTVVDPSWPRFPGGFQSDLVNGLISSYGPGSEPLPPRMNVIRKKAAQGLDEALAQGPSSGPDTEFWLHIAEPEADPLVLQIRNMGLTSRTYGFMPATQPMTAGPSGV
ncbi:conserved hypothetical protein [Arthrobacter sp. Hiyo1]|uniref:SIR2 family protein n=1 Tax=Arthrobacter sp. Hiyo1 TaxID=1588020 RepID=UPI0006A3CF95|nr:SIR2 family protein [Arthrobacter sp. Hiyo1]GAP61266.1 conserved hypothetical protein [Arthrobacter sp. Hiyo1]